MKNSNAQNELRDSSAELFIMASDREQSKTSCQHPVNQNKQGLPFVSEAPFFNLQALQQTMNTHTKGSDEQKQREFEHQFISLPNISAPQAPFSYSHPDHPLNNINIMGKKEQLVSYSPSRLVNGITSRKSSFEEFGHNPLPCFENSQPDVSNQNHEILIEQEFHDSIHQSNQLQSQAYSLTKRASSEKIPVLQHYGDALPAPLAQLPPQLSSWNAASTFPIIQQVTQTSNSSHNQSFEMMDNSFLQEKASLPNYQPLQPNDSIKGREISMSSQSVRDPLASQDPANFRIPVETPNPRTDLHNRPSIQIDNQYRTLINNLCSAPGAFIQNKPMIPEPSDQLFDKIPFNPTQRQLNQLHSFNNTNISQFADKFYPFKVQDDHSDFQAQNTRNVDFHSAHNVCQGQQPLYLGKRPEMDPNTTFLGFPPQNRKWLQQASMHFPHSYTGNPPINSCHNFPSSLMQSPHAYDNFNPQASFNKNLQNNNLSNSFIRLPSSYSKQHPLDSHDFHYANFDSLRNMQAYDDLRLSSHCQRENQAELCHETQNQFGEIHQNQSYPVNSMPGVDCSQDFTRDQYNNGSQFPSLQNSQSLSFNQPLIHQPNFLYNSVIGEPKSNSNRQELILGTHNQYFGIDHNPFSHSNNQFNVTKNFYGFNNSTKFGLSLVNQTGEVAHTPFPRLSFNPAKIIHFIQYSEASENGVVVEKYLLSDPELIRLGGFLSKSDSQPLIRSDEIDGIVVEFKKLANMNAKFIGAFGRPKIMFQALADNSFIDYKEISFFEKHFEKSGSGLYLLPMNYEKETMLILLILYSNDNRDFDKVEEKRSYVRLLRYLTQLCPINIAAINQNDVALISPDEGIETQNLFVYEPQAQKLTEDTCEIIEGKIIDSTADSKSLISASSHSGFYKKSYYPSKTEIREKVQVWKCGFNYDKNFHGCIVNVDKLVSVEIETIHAFLQDKFYEEFMMIQDALPEETRKLEEPHKTRIDSDVVERIKFAKTLLAMRCMKFPKMPEYKWLKRALNGNKISNPGIAAKITQSFKELASKKDAYTFDYERIRRSIFSCYLFETEIISLKHILAKKEIPQVDYSAYIAGDWQAQNTSPETLKALKENIYGDAIEKLNKKASIIVKLTTPWNYDRLKKCIQKIKSSQDFFDENSEACIKDALKLLELFYEEEEKRFNHASAEASIRKHHHTQFQLAAKSYLQHQAIKHCLEKKEGKLTVHLTDLKNVNRGIYQLKYEEENVIEAYNEYSVYQYELKKWEMDEARSNPDFIFCPTSKLVTSFKLPEGLELVNVIFMKENRLAVVVNYKDRSEIKFYNSARPNEALFCKSFGQTISKMDYNENKKKIAFCSQKNNEANIYVYGISDDFHLRNDAFIDLTARFGIAHIHHLCLGNNNEVFIADHQGNLRSIDYRNQTAKRINIPTQNLQSMFLVPGADCLLLITSTAIVPYIIQTDKTLPEIPLNPEVQLDNLVVTKFDSQVQLLFKCEGRICNKLLKCSLSTENYRLVDCTPKENRTNPENSEKGSLFDYFGHIYAKFSVYSPMEALDRQSIQQKLVIYCSHMRAHNQQEEDRIRYKLERIQNCIKKPHSEKLGLWSNAIFILPGEDHSKLLYSQLTMKSLDRWIQELVSLVPVQIGRTENNQYIILKQGKPLQLEDAHNVYEVKKRISYGPVEAILNNWHKPIKVISSMGKQSTGKSYTLNHLCGGTFAIAAGRCTDGCWLTLKITDECLYVLMDFEGLGSFERSEQEDMLLSIKNASLSNITLYKTAFSLDRDTDQMFYRFNQGANMLKGDDKIFKGLFCLLVKDIDDKNIKEVVSEFTGKMNKIIERGDKKDFITTMYGSGFAINAFDFFKNEKYYKQMESLAKFIRCNVKSQFTNGKDFLNLLKTIQAKLTIQDFTSLNRQDIDTRIYILSEQFLNALVFGNLADQKDNRSIHTLRSYDDSETVIEEEIEVEIESGQDTQTYKIFYSDPDINLMSESRDFIEVLNKIFPKTEENHDAWSSLLRDFVKAAIKKRIMRVVQWVDINMQKWALVEEFQELVANFKQLVGHKAKEIEMRYQICLSNCSSCFAACALLNSHTGTHSCGLADHKCKKVCAYCKDDSRDQLCSLDFGHNERHMCSIYGHTCGLPCKYYKCSGRCIQTTKHEGRHQCGLLQHVCPEECSLAICSNRCQISSDKEHTIHKCVNDQCSKNCEVQSCRNRCECNDHFHGYDNLSRQFKIENGIDISKADFITAEGKEINIDFHCCGIVHPCAEDCTEAGFCKVIVERKVVREEFKGTKGEFSYQKQFENIGSKLKCCKIIPEYHKVHEGQHLHSLDPATVHICETRCPTCNNICEKETNHLGKHNTAHGNMEKCYFVSNQDDIDVGDHKYVVGESAVAEMCHMFCKSLGRGHIHLVECGHTKETCPNLEQGRRRHETHEYGPDIYISKDEVLHEVYWDLINFEDPCQNIDVDQYNKCPFYCGSKDHENDEDKRYCQLQLWHRKINNISETGNAHGYASKDGHYYECTHNQNTNGYHFVFCLDKSDSMSGTPWADLSTAVRRFCRSRATSPADRLSIVTFDDTQSIDCENIPFNQFSARLHLVFRGGGTNFAPAISVCYRLFERNFHRDMTPVLVFMSDGGDITGDAEMINLNTAFGPYGLKVFAVAFGSVQPKLKQLADLVNGTYTTSINGIALTNTFMDISSQFPTIISVAPSKK